jgi:hypothetical protein
LIGGDVRRVEHVNIHVRMDGPIGGNIIARSDEHGVALRNGYTEQIDWGFLNVSLAADISAGISVSSTKESFTPSASIIRISWPSIQKKNAENAEVLMTRKR